MGPPVRWSGRSPLLRFTDEGVGGGENQVRESCRVGQVCQKSLLSDSSRGSHLGKCFLKQHKLAHDTPLTSLTVPKGQEKGIPPLRPHCEWGPSSVCSCNLRSHSSQ